MAITLPRLIGTLIATAAAIRGMMLGRNINH
jgi:hypothetical protein